jgi:hypothetical protein
LLPVSAPLSLIVLIAADERALLPLALKFSHEPLGVVVERAMWVYIPQRLD